MRVRPGAVCAVVVLALLLFELGARHGRDAVAAGIGCALLGGLAVAEVQWRTDDGPPPGAPVVPCRCHRVPLPDCPLHGDGRDSDG